MNSGFWMTDWFFSTAMAVPLWTLGFPGFGNVSSIDAERARITAIRSSSEDARTGELRPTLRSARCERAADILGVIPDVPQDSVRVLDQVTSKDPGQRFLGGEWFAAKPHAVFAGSVGEAAISVGGVNISL